jgi:hypothetical protein
VAREVLDSYSEGPVRYESAALIASEAIIMVMIHDLTRELNLKVTRTGTAGSRSRLTVTVTALALWQ